MIEKIAMWGGFVAIIVAVFAIIILYLTRSNIIELLDRDVVMYDKNYEAKKEALEQAFKCLDIVATNGVEVKNSPQFIAQAKVAYNSLLCTVYQAQIYQDFYRMTIDPSAEPFSIEDVEKFKISCRRELLAKRKIKGEGFKGVAVGGLSSGVTTTQASAQPRPQVNQRPQQRPQPRPQPRPQQNQADTEE